MPLLVCPNCQVEMNMISKEGIEFDMCSNCQSIWLDRGELEKIIRAAHDLSEFEKRTSNERKKRAQFWVDLFDVGR